MWLFIEAAFNEAEDHEDSDVIFQSVANCFAFFFVVDYVIQSCIIKKSKPDCCGYCSGCECGCFLVVKLIIDGFYLVLTILDVWVSFLTSSENISLFRVMRLVNLLIFVKLGLEIAAITILCSQKQHVQEVVVGQTVVGQPSKPVGQAVVGQPIVVASKDCDP
jgi:hypothetical protein